MAMPNRQKCSFQYHLFRSKVISAKQWGSDIKIAREALAQNVVKSNGKVEICQFSASTKGAKPKHPFGLGYLNTIYCNRCGDRYN